MDKWLPGEAYLNTARSSEQTIMLDMAELQKQESEHGRVGLFSLPREIRDEIYTYALVAPEPICFDKESGFMPAQELIQWGIVLMHPGCNLPQVLAEARSIFYRHNTFKLKCDAIASFLDFIPFRTSVEHAFNSRGLVTNAIIMVESVDNDLADDVAKTDYELLKELFRCPNLQKVEVQIRQVHPCYKHCKPQDWEPCENIHPLLFRGGRHCTASVKIHAVFLPDVYRGSVTSVARPQSRVLEDC